jgi:hypothetical protein
MNRFKDFLNKASGIVGFSVTVAFGFWLLLQPNSQSLNVASWAMWTLLDGVVVMLAIRSEKERIKKDPTAVFSWPYLFIGWTVAAVLVTASMLWNGAVWQIGFAEIVSMIAVAVATYLWWTNKWGMGLIACAIAMFIAGIPQIVNFWQAPAPATWWLWTFTGLACILSLAGSPKLKSLQNVPTCSSTAFQIVVLSVLFRGHPVTMVIQLSIIGLVIATGALWLVSRFAGRRSSVKQ